MPPCHPCFHLTPAFACTGGGGLLAEPDFFETEKGAPLLQRNNGYLVPGTPGGLPEGLRARLDAWPSLCGATAPADETGGGCEDEAALRIFLRDAERTFTNEAHRRAMIDLLKRVWPENRDYHQVCMLTPRMWPRTRVWPCE